MLQYWIASLCNQLLPEFSSNQFENFGKMLQAYWRCAYEFCTQKIFLSTKYPFSHNQESKKKTATITSNSEKPVSGGEAATELSDSEILGKLYNM